MAKRFRRSGNSLEWVIDRPLLEALEIEPDREAFEARANVFTDRAAARAYAELLRPR